MTNKNSLPLYQELQQKVKQENLSLDTELKLDGNTYLINDGLMQKLKRSKLDKPTSYALETFIDQPANEEADFENFWAPTQAEIDLLRYYLDASKTQSLLAKINQSHDDLLTQAKLQKLFKLNQDVAIEVFFVKESAEPLPDDCVFIRFNHLSDEGVNQIVDMINTRIDFECNSINHEGRLEIYGILPKIIKRLETIALKK